MGVLATAGEEACLEALFAVHAYLARAWSMLQELHGLYLAETEEAAMEALDRFSRMYAEDPLPEFYRVVDTLQRWPPKYSPSTRRAGSATAAWRGPLSGARPGASPTSPTTVAPRISIVGHTFYAARD